MEVSNMAAKSRKKGLAMGFTSRQKESLNTSSNQLNSRLAMLQQGQEELLKEADETGSLGGALSSVTHSTGTSQDTQASHGPAAPPLALVEMEPVSIWQDTQTWTIAGIALAVGFTIGILSAIMLTHFFN